MKQFALFLLITGLISTTSIASAQPGSYPFDVKITGQGKRSIIFIPGFASSGDVWNETRAMYEKNFTCYTLTMAGFAGVPAQKEATFEARKKSIAQYIQDKKIHQPIVIGHSMGGGWAMALAADYPDLISQIVVVDALPCLAATQDTTFKVDPNKDYSPIVSQFTAMSDKDFYAMQKRNIPYIMADTSHAEMAVLWSLKSDRATFALMFADFMNTDLRDKIAQIKCPALILLEPAFIAIKPAIEKQYSKLTTAQINYANKGLHFIMYDDTDWYQKQLATFIK